MFERYSNEELIVINSYDEDDYDETLVGFMPSHIDNEMGSFRSYLASLM